MNQSTSVCEVSQGKVWAVYGEVVTLTEAKTYPVFLENFAERNDLRINKTRQSLDILSAPQQFTLIFYEFALVSKRNTRRVGLEMVAFGGKPPDIGGSMFYS